MYEWLSKNYGYANILMAVFIAFWIKVLFRKHNYNYFEIYVLLCFVMGNSILISSLSGFIQGIIGLKVLDFGIIISVLYGAWAIGQFFDRKNKRSYLKGFFSYMLGFISSILILFAIAMGIEKLLL